MPWAEVPAQTKESPMYGGSGAPKGLVKALNQRMQKHLFWQALAWQPCLLLVQYPMW